MYSDVLLSNPAVSSFLMGTNKFEGNMDEGDFENGENGFAEAVEEKESAGEEKNESAEAKLVQVEEIVGKAGEVEVERAEEARVEGEGRRLVKEKVGDLVEETRAVDVEGGNTTAQAETISVKVEKKNRKEERDGACGEVFGVVGRADQKLTKAESKRNLPEVTPKSSISDEVAKEVKTETSKSRKAADVKLKKKEGKLRENEGIIRDQKSSSKDKTVDVARSQGKNKVVEVTRDVKSSSKVKVQQQQATKQITGTENSPAVGTLAEKRDPDAERNGSDAFVEKEVSNDKSLNTEAGKSGGEGENRSLNVRGSKTEAEAKLLKHVQEANMTTEKKKQHSKVNRTMVAPKVPEGITVKQATTSKQQQAARKQSEAAKKYVEEQTRATQAKEKKASTKVTKSSAEKRSQSEINGTESAAAADDDQPCPPFKRARRSDEARASPRKFELFSTNVSEGRATDSEFLRMKGRPVNAKGSKMIPMGRLRFLMKETIREGKCNGERRGGAEAFCCK